jgi:hypothetical protein
MLCISNRVTNDLKRMIREGYKTEKGSYILKEYLENTTSLFVDQARDTLHTTTARETTDGWLGNTYTMMLECSKIRGNASHTLNVVPKDLTMAFGTALSEALERNNSITLLCKPMEENVTFPPLPRPDIVFKSVEGRGKSLS